MLKCKTHAVFLNVCTDMIVLGSFLFDATPDQSQKPTVSNNPAVSNKKKNTPSLPNMDMQTLRYQHHCNRAYCTLTFPARQQSGDCDKTDSSESRRGDFCEDVLHTVFTCPYSHHR